MKILIFGAGVIGTTYAWQLAEAGFDVTLFVRKLRMVRYANSGQAITYSDLRKGKSEYGNTVFRPQVVEALHPKQDFDLIIVSVRSNQWHDAIPYVAKNSGNAHILFLGNMWNELQLADKHLPKGRYFLCFPNMVMGGHIENGISTYLFGNENTMLGEPDGKVSERVQKFADILDRAGMQPRIYSKMRDYLRMRYLLSAITPGLLSKAGGARLLSGNKTLLTQYVIALKEGQKLCRKMGVGKAPLFPFNRMFLPAFFLRRMITARLTDDVQAALDTHMKHGEAEKKKQYENVLVTGRKMKVSMPYWASFEKYMDF